MVFPLPNRIGYRDSLFPPASYTGSLAFPATLSKIDATRGKLKKLPMIGNRRLNEDGPSVFRSVSRFPNPQQLVPYSQEADNHWEEVTGYEMRKVSSAN
jgi:hypothetical protein